MTVAGPTCREITPGDRDGVVGLLTAGFSDQRQRAFWTAAFDRLTVRECPAGYPRYGYLLESAGAVVGVILLIFSQAEPPLGVRCNVSSWWVQPAFRMVGSLLISRAFRHAATYTNITPAPHTLPILAAQGYRPFCQGRMITAGWLVRDGERASVQRYRTAMRPGDGLTPDHIALLREHAGWGCLALVCTAAGQRHPFVFAPRRRAGVVRLAVLTYAAEDDAPRRFAGALGRYLARRGFPLMVIDSDGPVPGLPGRYAADKPKFYRGPDRPRAADYAYSERAVFGS